MIGIGLGSASAIKDIISYQVAQWYFGNFFVLFELTEIIVVDADGLFL